MQILSFSDTASIKAELRRPSKLAAAGWKWAYYLDGVGFEGLCHRRFWISCYRALSLSPSQVKRRYGRHLNAVKGTQNSSN